MPLTFEQYHQKREIYQSLLRRMEALSHEEREEWYRLNDEVKALEREIHAYEHGDRAD